MAERASVIDVPGLLWDAGAPSPVLLASEDRTLFTFDAPGDETDYRRLAEFVRCTSVRFGFPNDEAQGGHHLYGKGLAFYSAHEVVNSRWLQEMREIERSHPYAPDVPFADARHFLLTFHDSTLEAIAADVRVLASFASDEEAAQAMWRAVRR